MATIADLVIRLGLQDDASKGISGVAGKIERGFSRAVLPATIALGAVAAGAKKVIDDASDMNETVSKTHVVFGDAGDALEDWGEDAAENLGLGKQAALDAAATYGTFGKAAGLTGKALERFSVPLVKSAGDLASFHNVPVAQALEDIRSGLAGETEPLRKYGILLNDAQLRQEALAMGLVKTTKDALSPQNKMLAAQQLILQGLGPAQGDFARTSSSAANQERIQAAEAANLNAQLGSGLLPVYQSLQRVLLTVTRFMAEHTTAVKVVAAVVVVLAVGVLAVNAAFKVYRAATIAATAVTWLLNAALAANPIVLVVAALAALGVALYLAWTKSETFRRIVTAAWNAVKTFVLNALNAVIGFVKRWWPLLLAVFTGGLGLLVVLIVKNWTAIKEKTVAVWNAIKGFIQRWWPLLLAVMTGGLSLVVALIISKWSSIKAATSAAWNAVASFVTGAVNRVRNAVRVAFDAVSAIVRAAIGRVRAGVNGLVAVFRPIINVLNSIMGAARSAVSAIESVLSVAGKVTSIPGKLGGLIPGFASGVRNFGGGLAVVGEAGPELVNLPRGADVFSNRESAGMLAGAGGPYVVVKEMNVRSDVDVRLVARELARRVLP